MNRAILALGIFVLFVSSACAIGPVVVDMTTDARGVTYKLGYSSAMSRNALADWFAQSMPWGPDPVIVRIDATTPFVDVADLLSLLKERAGVERFELHVTAEAKGEAR